MFLALLAESLRPALGERLRVERGGGWFRRDGPIRCLELDLDADRFALAVGKGGALSATRCHIVRGIALKTEELSVESLAAGGFPGRRGIRTHARGGAGGIEAAGLVTRVRTRTAPSIAGSGPRTGDREIRDEQARRETGHQVKGTAGPVRAAGLAGMGQHARENRSQQHVVDVQPVAVPPQEAQELPSQDPPHVILTRAGERLGHKTGACSRVSG